MGKLNFLDMLVMLLVVIGALNWGLVGLLDLNLVNSLVGTIPMLEKAIYVVVGLSGVYALYLMFKMSK